MAVNVFHTSIKAAAVTGIALFWVNLTIEAFKVAWHIISTSPGIKAVHDDGAIFKAVCGHCQELYDDDEYHLIHGSHLCEACR